MWMCHMPVVGLWCREADDEVVGWQDLLYLLGLSYHE